MGHLVPYGNRLILNSLVQVRFRQGRQKPKHQQFQGQRQFGQKQFPGQKQFGQKQFGQKQQKGQKGQGWQGNQQGSGSQNFSHNLGQQQGFQKTPKMKQPRMAFQQDLDMRDNFQTAEPQQQKKYPLGTVEFQEKN